MDKLQDNQALIEQRRLALAQHLEITGLDTVNVVIDNGVQLHLFFIKKSDAAAQIIPPNITAESIRFSKIERETPLNFLINAITYPQIGDPPERLIIHLSENVLNDVEIFADYQVSLLNVAAVDPFFKSSQFSFSNEIPAEFDAQQPVIEHQDAEPAPEIDYLAKDYQSFRQVMLDRLSVLMPNWQANSPADLTVTLVENMAYAADQLSYYQDAIATEAYLETARRRVSVKRHARLLDYRMHEGCNARVWVQVGVTSNKFVLPAGTQLLTKVAGTGLRVLPDSDDYRQLIGQKPTVFETLHPVALSAEHNQFDFYTWGADNFVLTKGTTKATLLGDFTQLSVGDVILLEQVLGKQSGLSEDVDPTHRHPVRITDIRYLEDALGGQFLQPATQDAVKITEITWHAEDALPFDLIVNAIIDNQKITQMARASGNMVLADHGRTVEQQSLLPALVNDKKYRPRLVHDNLTFATPWSSTSLPASALVYQLPSLAEPVIRLYDDKSQWQARLDLLDSNQLAQDFVVEIENDRRVYLRFGNGNLGKKPSVGNVFNATYRIGNGSQGNIGADVLAHIVTDESGIITVRNPLPAKGGVDPELIDEVQRNAPQAFRKQERAVTEQDYIDLALAHPQVDLAAAKSRWTGSWNTLFIAIKRKDGLALDDSFKQTMTDYFEQFRLLGRDVKIIEPRYVALDITLVVYVKKGYLANVVRQSLLERFSHRELEDGTMGFFHHSNFGFGQSIYLSQLITEIMQIDGVDWIDKKSPQTRFQRWRQDSQQALDDGVLDIDDLEIAKLVNNPAKPENGRIRFLMEMSA